MCRKISAHYIFQACQPPLKQGIVVIADDGTIIDIIDTNGKLRESEGLEFYDGIITPGFINTHTHLELSHLKGVIPENIGLLNFIKSVGVHRNINLSESAIIEADAEMSRNGIVAAADISNSTDSFNVKANSKINYFTFIELLGIDNEKAHAIIENGKQLLQELNALSLAGTLAPHAPYSLSDNLLDELTAYSQTNINLWTIHNQESAEETKLFNDKTGEFIDFLTFISPNFANWQPKGCSSLQYLLQFYRKISRILLVHNTFTTKADLKSIETIKDKVVAVLCPNANLYIENQLPDVNLLRQLGCVIALGTDSLASNSCLSILEEMKTLHKHFNNIPLTDLIDWATINGAKVLGFDSTLGSITLGKTPGLNLVTNVDFDKMLLTSRSKIKVLA